MCEFWELSCKVGEVVSEASDNIISQWAESVMESLSNTLIKVGTAWVGVGTPTVEGGDSAVGFIHSHTTWLVVAVAIGSFVVAGVQLAWTRRGEPARDLLRSMFTLVVTSTVGVSIAQLLITASDAFSKWILSEAGAGDDGQFATKILSVSLLSPGTIGMFVVIVAGLFGVLANLVQIGLMFVRSAMLILLVAMVPLAGSATNTKWGQAWLSKTIAWFVAFLMFKPAASIVYAVAIKLIQGDTWSVSEGDDLTSFVLGIVMMVLAVFALPALMAFMVPATGAIAGGGAGATAGGAVMATGAMSAARSMGSGSVSGGGGGASGTGGGGAEAASGASATPGASSGGTSPAGGGGGGVGSATGGAPGGGAAGASGGGAAAAGAAGGPAGAAAGAVVQGAGKAVSAVKGATQSAVAESGGSPTGAQSTTAPATQTPTASPSRPSGSSSPVEHTPTEFDDSGASGAGEVSR